jgi:hypothetical protein
MQTFASHTGISSAMLRFSQRVVAVGYVPSTGSALTGKSSPSPVIIFASTSRTNCGDLSGTVGRAGRPGTTVDGTFTSCRKARAASTALMFMATISSPFLP